MTGNEKQMIRLQLYQLAFLPINELNNQADFGGCQIEAEKSRDLKSLKNPKFSVTKEGKREIWFSESIQFSKSVWILKLS